MTELQKCILCHLYVTRDGFTVRGLGETECASLHDVEQAVSGLVALGFVFMHKDFVCFTTKGRALFDRLGVE